MKSLNLAHLDLSTMPKAVILSAAVILAACSRNPQPGADETGRADTTIVNDSAYRAPVDTAYRVPSDTMMPAPTPGVGDSLRDSVIPQPQVPSDTVSNRIDSSRVLPDSANVPHDAKKFEGDSAMIDHNVPDSAGKSADSTGGR